MSKRSIVAFLACASAAGLALQRAQAETLGTAALIQDQTVQQGQLSAFVATLLQAAKHRLSGIANSLALAPGEFARLVSEVSTAMPTGNGIVTLTYGLILVIVGAGAEWLYWTYATPAVIALEAAALTSRREAFSLAMRRLALRAFGLVLFVVAIVGAAAYFDWPAGFDGFVIASILLIVFVRLAWLVADVIAAPGHPQLRLGDIDPAHARRFVAGFVGMAFLLALSHLLPELLEYVAGAPHAASAVRVISATLITLIVLVAVLTGLRRGRAAARASGRLPRFPYGFLAAALILGIYGVWLAAGSPLATLLAILVIVAAVQAWLRRWVFFYWPEEVTPDGSTIGAGLIPNIVLSMSRYVVVLLGIGAALIALDAPMRNMAGGDSPLMRFVLHLLGVAGLALVINVGWVAIRELIDRRLRAIGPFDPHAEPGPNARLRTLLPLLRMTSAIVLLVLLVLSALWTLGIEITPLLAGAGVLGLAVGFGAQALVRDIIAGIFYLVEDVFRIGEYIESGSSTKGTVERITLRTVALRHHNGPLHFVPYGSLGTVRNNSRDWVIEKFNLPLPVAVDSEQVRKIIKKVGEGMQADPDIGPLIREPLKAKLYRIDPGIKIFRCKFQTAPGKQFDVRAEAFKRIETALKAAGISFADGLQTVVIPGSQAFPGTQVFPGGQPAVA
ncbi:mechanosensitive ion channel domain-containing protein [Labrys neptuniae]